MEIRIGAKKLLNKARRSSPPSPPQFLLLAVVSQALLLLLRRMTLQDPRCNEPSFRHIGPMTTHGPHRAKATHAGLKPPTPTWNPPTHGPTPIWSHPLYSPSSTDYNPCFYLWFFFFFSLSLFLLWWEGVKGVLKVINRVLKTRFPGGCYVEKMSHQTWSNHENRVFETQFIAQNRVFETRDVRKIYTFETVPTNYIVRKMGLIPNFGLSTRMLLTL